MASWLLTQHTKAKKKEEQEENKDDNVDHQHLPDPRQHRKSSFSATNVSERTTSISAQLQLSNLHRIHPWWVFNFVWQPFLVGAVETCIHTGSAEEVLECVKNILDSLGQGDCKTCICDIIPGFCQGKNVEPVKTEPRKISDVESKLKAEKDLHLRCNFLTCTGSILGKIWFEQKEKTFLHIIIFLEAVKTCLHTGSAEEVLDCVKNILDSIGQGDCKECICDIIPSFCKVWNINLDLSWIPPASF